MSARISGRAIAALSVCYIIGAILAPVALFLAVVQFLTSEARPLNPALVVLMLPVFSYAIGGAVGNAVMSNASRAERTPFLVGAGSACVAAAPAVYWMLTTSGSISRQLLATLLPIPISIVATLVWIYRSELDRTGAEVTAGLAARAASGRKDRAMWSLLIFLFGYAALLLAPSIESMLIAVTASAVSLFLSIRALPNVMAIIAFGSSMFFLANLFWTARLAYLASGQ